MRKVRKISVFGLMILFLTNLSGNAQDPAQSIPSRQLEIAYSKTTNIIFPFAIKSVDRGSRDILAQKAGGIENVLQLKAAKEDFQETNLTVVTADGNLYSFTLNYSEEPAVQNLTLVDERPQQGGIHFSSEKFNVADVRFYSEMVALEKNNMVNKKDEKFGITMLLNGIYIHDNVIYYRIKLSNNTHISYDIDQLRFFIRDQKKAKRTASQEIEVTPVHIEGDVKQISGKTQQVVVFALPKFTIPDQKYLAIQLMEKNGGRHLSLKVRNNIIIKSQPLGR